MFMPLSKAKESHAYRTAHALQRREASPIDKMRQMVDNSPRVHQLKALQATASSTPTAQRMVIRMRNAKEMMGIGKPTIMESSHKTSKDMGGDEQSKETIGINQAVKGRQLGKNEELRIVAHGGGPSLPTFIRSGLPSLGGEAPAALADKLKGLFPSGYSGTIYMNGCDTATRLDFQAASSYIELFAQALAGLRGDIKFVVRGNLGSAATANTGEEYITLEKSVALLAKQLHWPVHEVKVPETQELRYVVVSPYGLAYASSDGVYQDGGLSVAFAEQARKIEEDRARREAPEKASLLRSEHIQSGKFGINATPEGNPYINNDML